MTKEAVIKKEEIDSNIPTSKRVKIMNNKILTIIFLSLLSLYVLTRLFSGRPERTFSSELVQVDTSMVDKIELYPKPEQGEQPLILQRTDGSWTVTNGKISAPATNNAVTGILGQLSLTKAKRVVAKATDKWKDYEVDEAHGIRVKAYTGDIVLADFMVGRFNFNPQTRQAISYLRLSDEEEVYAVDGFLSMTFGQDINAFRNKQILKLEGDEEVSSLQLQTGEGEIQFQKSGTTWMTDNTPVDSTAMASYLSGLRFVAGNTFVDDFMPAGKIAHTLRIVAGTEPVTIRAYPSTGGDPDFVIQSSQYPDAFFASDSSGIYQRLFGKLAELKE